MEREKCNRYEMELVELLMFAAGILRHGESKVIDRIKKVKHGPRRYHTIITLMEKLCIDLIATISEGNLKQLRQLEKVGRLTIKPQPIADIPGYYLLPHDTGIAIIESCLRNECAMCIKDGDEYPKCNLYKAMIDVMPPDRINKFTCPYQAVRLYKDSTEDGGADE